VTVPAAPQNVSVAIVTIHQFLEVLIIAPRIPSV